MGTLFGEKLSVTVKNTEFKISQKSAEFAEKIRGVSTVAFSEIPNLLKAKLHSKHFIFKILFQI